jgi:hypothetical protein
MSREPAGMGCANSQWGSGKPKNSMKGFTYDKLKCALSYSKAGSAAREELEEVALEGVSI